MAPGIRGQRDLAPAGRRPKRGEERQVHAEQSVFGRDRLHQPDGPPERRRPRSCLADPHRVRARLDLAEVTLVHARRDLIEADLVRGKVRPDDDRHRPVEVARRAVALDALDVQPRPAAERLERCLDPARLLARKRPADELAEEPAEAVPADPVLGPSPRGVRGPRHGPPEAVLPLREEGIVARRDQHELRRGLDRRAVVAEELGEAGLQAADDRRGGGLDRVELLFDDLLAGDLLRLLQEDVRDRRDVRGGVEPAAALLRELLEERIRAAARANRRERDPCGLHPLEDLVVLAGSRPAVGQQDDVAARRGDLLERLHGLVEARVDVRLAERVDARDRPLEVADVAQRLGLDDPVGGLVEGNHAKLVARAQRSGRAQDRLLADIDLAHPLELAATAHAPVEAVAVAGVHRARLVDHDHEGDVRLTLPIANAHVDRQRLLHRRLRVAARAVGARATDHHQAAAEVAHVARAAACR